MKEAVLFLVDYIIRPEAQWDGQYHIYPTVVPELYGLTPGLKKNFDCLVDLTLTKFVFRAYLEAVPILGLETNEAELTSIVRRILDHFPDYATAESVRGKVFVSVPGENPEVVYNTPNSTMTVFPGEDHGLHSPPEQFEIAANSYRQHRNEGGNDLVFMNLQGARLGMLDLERFKRQINYCLLPNGVCQDMVLQVHGRYPDLLPYDFMCEMGIWFENLALPVVVNECLLQSYNGTLRLFPNWPLTQSAEFHTLRAVGGFLVSAVCTAGTVQWVCIFSEVGTPLKLVSPWKANDIIERTTYVGEVIMLKDGAHVDS
jgi:alpha-L-fucosidase 2